jgi:hypothetical protein
MVIPLYHYTNRPVTPVTVGHIRNRTFGKEERDKKIRFFNRLLQEHSVRCYDLKVFSLRHKQPQYEIILSLRLPRSLNALYFSRNCSYLIVVDMPEMEKNVRFRRQYFGKK